VAVGTALSGIADCGYGIATAAACFSTIPMAAARPAYFALSSLVPSAVFAVGSGLAAPLLHALHRVASSAGLPAEAHFRLFFGLVSAMMVVCGFSVLLLPGRRGTRPISTGVNA
jgi:hypothetical protein